MSTVDQGISTETATAYDVMPYPSGSFPQSHPNRLAGMGRLFGLQVKAPSSARVLELGCADGANLLPMADQLRGATFLGIDASKVQVAAGQKMLEASGLKNVELRHQNILEFPDSEGKFDYIIVHGIFSWVPEPVREKILDICSRNLAESGIAYVSYNALPGWNMRRSLRDMVQFHTSALKEPQAKVQQTRALVKFLSESVPTENNSYGLFLKAELDAMSKQLDGYLAHDILEEENTAFYFHQFIARAAQHGLQYVSEPGLSQMLAANFPEKVRDTLSRIGAGVVAQEQYMDFLRNRTFRQTLLCHAGQKVVRQIQPQVMRELAFQSMLKRPDSGVDLSAGTPVSFVSNAGPTVTASDSFVKAIFKVLTDAAPGVVAYGAVLEAARAASRPHLGTLPPNRDEIDEATLQSNLLSLCSKGFVDAYAEPVQVATAVPAKPALTALQRNQGLHSRLVVNRLHVGVPADILGRYVMAACNGARDREGIISEIMARVNEGKLQAKEKDQIVTDRNRLHTLLSPQVDGVLKKLTALGFFA